jgi:hypothetical protein
MALHHAKDFELEELILITVTGKEWDIGLLLSELNIYEDIYSASVSADLILSDAENRLRTFPITGHEWIRFKFRTPDKNYVSMKMRIYKISNRGLDRERKQVFLMNCIDAVQFTNAETVVSKAYKGKLISDIADDIQRNFLNSSFQRLETTKNLFHFIPANWTPIQSLNWLSRRATSQVYNGANYVYFQDVDGYNFTSLENLCEQVPKIAYMYQTVNVRDQEAETINKPRELDLDMVAIQSYNIESNFDTLENVSYGMYGNKLIWHNIQTKEHGEEEFNYVDSYDSFRHVEPNNVAGGKSWLWTSASDFGVGARLYASTGFENQESHVRRWLKERTSQMQQLQNVRIHLTVPGDSDRRAGDIVTVILPSPEPPVNRQLKLDDHYIGRYLVTSVRHIIVPGSYVTVLEVVKDSVFTAYP